MMRTATGNDGFKSQSAACVGLAFDAAAAETKEGRCAMELILRLLVRQWSRVVVEDISGGHAAAAEGLVDLGKRIDPTVCFSEAPEEASLTLVVGATHLAEGRPAFYVGSRGWVARCSAGHPTGSGETANPLGAAAAACLGVANAFRLTVVGPGLQPAGSNVDDTIELSVFDYSRGSTAANPDLPTVDLGITHLVGLDGIGSATTWALARLENVHGTLHLVDGSTIERSTLRRHILATPADVGKRNVEVAAQALSSTALDVAAHQCTWAQYVTAREDRMLPRVAIAAGTPAERAAVQASLPRVIVNAWTQSEDVGVSRHADFLRAPCLACLYGPRETEPGISEIAARGTGRTAAQPGVQDMLSEGKPVDRVLVERVAAARGVDASALMPFLGTTPEVFYLHAVREGVLDDGTWSGASVGYRTTAFQAALAGVLLAAEIVVDAVMTRAPLPALTRIDPLRPLAAHLTVPAARDPYGRCLCGDADYREVYARKYLA